MKMLGVNGGDRNFKEKNMTGEEILKVSRELIGTICPIANSCIDEIKMMNANKSYTIISGLIEDIWRMVCESNDSDFGSVEKCRQNGIEILETLKSEIEDYLSDIE